MNDMQRGVLALIRCAITEEAVALPKDFDLEAALPEILRYRVGTLVYAGAVRCGISQQTPAMMRLFKSNYAYMIRSEKQMREVERLFRAFDEAQIDYLPMKGCRMKGLYPNPNLRLMGDADILIREEQYDKIEPIMADMGFVSEANCEHVYAWRNENIIFELHTHLLPPDHKDFYAYFQTGWQLAVCKEGTRYQFVRPEEEFIFLFTHFCKHYRLGGIGCRHVVDLWLYRRSYPDMDEAYLAERLQKLHLLEFYQNIVPFIEAWFEDGPMTEMSEFISGYIFSSGNWGSAKTHVLACATKSLQTKNMSKFYKVRRFLEMLFQDRKTLARRYPVVDKYPVLLPVFWVVRVVSAMASRRQNVKKLWNTYTYSKLDRVETFQQSLDYVGLHFHYKY